LKAKYKTLDALNAAWYRGFERWEQVEPPRSSTILSYTDYIDWRTYIDDKLAGDLKTRVEAIRSGQPGPTTLAINKELIQPITSHAAVPGLFTSPTDSSAPRFTPSTRNPPDRGPTSSLAPRSISRAPRDAVTEKAFGLENCRPARAPPPCASPTR
jgi:beta-galactosidase